MKNLLIFLGLGVTLLSSCTTGSRLGYSHYDDVYDVRPTYTESKRTSPTVYDNSNYAQPNYAESNSEYQARTYIDDEQVEPYGDYTERIRRFHSGSSGFDYYSPYYTGYNDGFNYGLGIGTGIGYSTYGRWSSSLWNPYYSSSIYFGWGRPSWRLGVSTWYYPTFYDPFYNPYRTWAGPWFRTGYGYGYYGSGWGIPYYGWGGNSIFRNDYTIKNSNRYYAPRVGNYNNQSYNAPRTPVMSGGSGGGKTNTAPSGTTQPANRGGSMIYTPKSGSGGTVAPAPKPSSRPNTVSPSQSTQPTRNNVPSRYQQNNPDNQAAPSKSKAPKSNVGGKSNTPSRNNMPSRYNRSNNTPSSPSFSSPGGRSSGGSSIGRGSSGGSNRGGSRGGSMNRSNK